MRKIELTMPQLGFIVATRAALALGVGLLISSQLEESERRKIGGALVGLGAVTTIPAAMFVMRARRRGRRRSRYAEFERGRPLRAGL